MLKKIVLAVLVFSCGFMFHAEAKGIPVLLYHQVNNDYNSSLAVTEEAFAQQVEALKLRGYETISSEQLVAYMNGQKSNLPEKPLLITFDDGYADNYLNAYPILKRYGYTAIIFMVGMNVDREGRLSTDMLKEMMADGFTVGSHTLSHKFLTETAAGELSKEIKDSKTRLETALGQPITLFSYPGGYCNYRVYEEVVKHYSAAFMTRPGFNAVDTGNIYLMYRIPIFSFTDFDSLLESIEKNNENN